jgi:hypothetical protein
VNTIICTDAERDLILTGARHLVVPGDRVRDLALDAYLTPDSAPIPGFKIVAPQRWVEATGPCETCEGDGVIEQWADEYHFAEPDCSDCVDGRKRVALVVTCPDDGTVALLTERERHQPRRPFIQATKCSTCSGTGRVVFAHATVEVGPVIDGSQEWDGGGVVYDTSHLWLYNGSSTGGYQLTLDPLPVPGRDWVVVLDDVGMTL